MSGNGGGLATALRHAERERDQALIRMAAAMHRLNELDARRHQVLVGAGGLDGPGVPLGLRGHLTHIGGRHLNDLVEERVTLSSRHREEQEAYEEAAVKAKALERITERRRQAAELEARRRRDREWQDLVVARTAGAGR